MNIGFTAINVGNLAVPQFGQIAALAEELGYESLWTAEHIVLPDLPRGEAERPGDLAFLDSIALLGFLAAHTRAMKLATGVLLLPQHHPLLLAKQIASVDVLSGGRVILGIGIGSVEPEHRAMGVPMSERGARATEYLDAMFAMWSQPHPSYSGKHVSFEGINAYPRPIQQPHPPIVIGGRAEGALRRMARYGSGWFGFNMTLEQTREQLRAIDQVMQRYAGERPSGLGGIEITINPREPLNAETVHAYEAAGVHRLVLRLPINRDLREVESFIRENAPARVGAA